MLRPVRLAPLISCAALALCAPDAAAQEAPSVALNQYQPSPAGDAFFGVPAPWIGGHLVPRFAVTFDYARDPLVLVDQDGERRATIVSSQAYLHLGASFALFDRLLIAADFPLAVLQTGSEEEIGGVTIPSAEGFEPGDLRLGLRGRLYGDYYQPFQIAVGGYLFVPTGPSESYVAEGAVYGQPQLLLGGRADNFVWSASAGAILRASDNPHTVTFKGAVGLELLDGAVMLGPEVYGSAALEDTVFLQDDALTIPRTTGLNLEGLFGAQGYVLDGLTFGAAGGLGLTNGVGSPRFRVLGRIAWAPRPTRVEAPGDRDNDGITDDVDACPDVKGFPSEDPLKHGCPRASDLDGDDILDDDDACPKVPGVAHDDPKKHGCPPPSDRDGDKILDKDDACPDKPGVPDDDPAKHGCPPPGDRDADGIIDEVDACPDVRGIENDDPTKNGCPPDTDGDGIVDSKDACPDTPGVASDDPNRNGCPPDRDGDTILDQHDACPDTPGVKQRDPKKNGCPRAIVTDKEIRILERVEFATGRSVIKRVSDPLLDDVAALLKKHTDIELLEVQGHTDNRGGKAYNQRLSEARAKAVRAALVRRGIDRSRLTFKGYGMDKPRASNATKAGRQENRRVQFTIVRRRKK